MGGGGGGFRGSGPPGNGGPGFNWLFNTPRPVTPINVPYQTIDVRAVQRAIDTVDANFKLHDRRLNDLQRALADLHYQRDMEAYKEAIRESFRGSQSYANVVIGFGYAGYFALWTFVRGDLNPQLHAWSAFFLAISLIVYIGWEVFAMASLSFQMRELGEQQNAEEVRKLVRNHEDGRLRHWPMALALTVTPAVLGASALMYGLITNLVSKM